MAKETPKAARPSAAEIARLRKEAPQYTERCINDFLKGQTAPIRDENCYHFGKPERMSGWWWAYFEGSRFCPRSSKGCEKATRNRVEKPSIWLAFAEPVKLDWSRYSGGVYAIDFVGRRSVYPGRYGHLGGFDEEVIVDRVISIKQVEAPRG